MFLEMPRTDNALTPGHSSDERLNTSGNHGMVQAQICLLILFLLLPLGVHDIRINGLVTLTHQVNEVKVFLVGG